MEWETKDVTRDDVSKLEGMTVWIQIGDSRMMACGRLEPFMAQFSLRLPAPWHTDRWYTAAYFRYVDVKEISTYEGKPCLELDTEAFMK